MRRSVAIVTPGSVKDITDWKESIVIGCSLKELVLVHGDKNHALEWGCVVGIVVLWGLDDEVG